MSSVRRALSSLLSAAIALVAVVVLAPSEAAATPFYSVGSAHACNTCHVEPTGWHNPQTYRNRRCTLDCQGCHYSPTGGGLRTPLGRYYAAEELAMWGARPSSWADPDRFLREGEPNEGRYLLGRGGFSGWWPGEVQHREIPDRYGRFDADPTWAVGGDFRWLGIVPTDGDPDREFVGFPMELQAYVAANPLPNLTAYLDLGYQGSRNRGIGGSQPVGDTVWYTDLLWIREVFVMVHDLPYSSYVRAGRFNLPYGWRISDHTAYIRQGLFDQYRQAYGVEVGFAPNEYWGNLALWYQGIDDWPGERGMFPQAFGATAQGGVRYLGYTLGGSLHAMNGEQGSLDEFMVGPMWGINYHPIVYLGELDYRRENIDGLPGTNQLRLYHELQVQQVTGFTPKLRFEWEDRDMDIVDDHRSRLAVGAEWNPLAQLQMDALWRQELLPEGTGASELLIQLHAHW